MGGRPQRLMNRCSRNNKTAEGGAEYLRSGVRRLRSSQRWYAPPRGNPRSAIQSLMQRVRSAFIFRSKYLAQLFPRGL